MKYFIIACLFVSIVSGHINFILIGLPGSGKRTFGRYLERTHGYYQIFPEKISWRVAIPFLPPCLFNNSKYFYGLLFHKLRMKVKECVEENRPFVLQYFPQNKCSLDFLEDLCQFYNIKDTIRIVYFVVDDEICLERANNRMRCLNCYTIFNKITCPSQYKGRCDSCKAILTTHKIDQEVVEKELLFYRKFIEPLVELTEQYFYSINFFADVPLEECAKYYESFFNLNVNF